MAGKRIAGIRLAHGRYESVRGVRYDTPKEAWGLRTARAAVPAAPAAPSPEQAARAFLNADSDLFELDPDLAGRLDPPCLRRLDSAHTCADFHFRGDDHKNGPTGSSSLRAARAIFDADRN
jgi:hypothetical protein